MIIITMRNPKNKNLTQRQTSITDAERIKSIKEKYPLAITKFEEVRQEGTNIYTNENSQAVN